MANLTRQTSRFREVAVFLADHVQVDPQLVEGYAAALVDDGFDTRQLVLELTVEELTQDYAWKRGQALKLDKFRAEAGVLDDGTSVSLDSPRAHLGRGGCGEVTAGTRLAGDVRAAVACKSLVAGSTKRDRQRFLRECALALDASRRCTRAAHAYGCTALDGTTYLVMKRYRCDFSKLLKSR